jgi:ZIP family zinc transporter
VSPAFEAAFWGFVGGGALVLGAAVGYLVQVPNRVVAGVMAFGSGVLISALSFELMAEAFKEAGLTAAASPRLPSLLGVRYWPNHSAESRR